MPAEALLRAPSAEAPLRLVVGATPLAVRDALRAALRGMRQMQLDEVDCARAELALAEAMNNIVEHAYAGTRGGRIELQVRRVPDALDCILLDRGAALHGGVPRPRLPGGAPSCATAEEGGYGWGLIHALCDGVDYRREGGRNRLHLRLPLGGG